MTSFQGNSPIANNLYGVANGTSSDVGFITVFMTRNPGPNDFNYQVKTRWLNTTASIEWILTGFNSNSGVTTANWLQLGDGDAINSIAVPSGISPVVSNPAGQISFTSNNSSITITGSANNIDFATTIPEVPSSFNEINIKTFPTSATYTPSPGMEYCLLEAWGGGGGGGGSQPCSSSQCSAGGGGGGGGYSSLLTNAAAITAASPVVVTIGAGGVGGTSSTLSGSAGGNTTVGSFIQANGGGGASFIGAITSALNVGSGGVGGLGSGGNIFGGGAGTFAILSSVTGQVAGGIGGTSGKGGGGGIGALNGTGAGSNGSNYGGGGGGSACVNSGAGSTGGTGANGFVTITEFISS